MPYINSDGTVTDSRSPFRLSIVSDFLWAVVNTVALFVDTLINPRAPVKKIVNNGFNSSQSGGSDNNAPKKKGPNIKTLPKNCTKSS
jgi:hypothetical protein